MNFCMFSSSAPECKLTEHHDRFHVHRVHGPLSMMVNYIAAARAVHTHQNNSAREDRQLTDSVHADGAQHCNTHCVLLFRSQPQSMWPLPPGCLVCRSSSGREVCLLTEFEQFRSEHAGFAVLVYAGAVIEGLMPMFEAAAAQPGVPPLMMTDGTGEALATKLDVKGYPTVLFIRRGDGPPIEYDGERKASAIAAWAKLKLQPLDERARALATPSAVLSFVKGAPMGLILFASDAASAAAELLLAVAASAPDIRGGISTADPSSPELGLRAGAASRRWWRSRATRRARGTDPQRPITHARSSASPAPISCLPS